VARNFDIGDALPLSWELFEEDGTTPLDATVSVTVTLPDGTTSSPAVTHDGTGRYSATYTAAQAGTHRFRWVATGTAVAAEEGAFQVRRQGSVVIDYDALKDRLNKSGARHVDDDELADMLDAALAEYETYVGPLPGTVTESHDGGYGSIVLGSSAVSAVTAAAYSDGTTITLADLDLDTRTGILHWGYNTTGWFTSGRRNVTITYTVGALPANHREAIIDALAWYFRSTQHSSGAGQADFPGEGGEGGAPGEFFFSPSWQGVQSRIRALAGPTIA
jgi:hypothetical protein